MTADFPSATPGFVYTAVKKAPRKNARPSLIGHQWRCLKCNEIVHREGMVGIDETPEEASVRHKRIAVALDAHLEARLEQEQENA